MHTRLIKDQRRWYCCGTWILAPIGEHSAQHLEWERIDSGIRSMTAYRPMLITELADRLGISFSLTRARARRLADRRIFDSKMYPLRGYAFFVVTTVVRPMIGTNTSPEL